MRGPESKTSVLEGGALSQVDGAKNHRELFSGLETDRGFYLKTGFQNYLGILYSYHFIPFGMRIGIISSLNI